jgi:hypothetical protein
MEFSPKQIIFEKIKEGSTNSRKSKQLPPSEWITME